MLQEGMNNAKGMILHFPRHVSDPARGIRSGGTGFSHEPVVDGPLHPDDAIWLNLRIIQSDDLSGVFRNCKHQFCGAIYGAISIAIFQQMWVSEISSLHENSEAGSRGIQKHLA